MANQPSVNIESLARRIGREGFLDPRSQYIYSPSRPALSVLACIWGLQYHHLYKQQKTALKKGDDWAVARRENLKAVAAGIRDATRKQVAEDVGDTVAVYRQCVNIAVLKCTAAINAPLPAAMDPLARAKYTEVVVRTLKHCFELENRISGRQAVSEIYEKRRAENSWFVEIIKRTVRDPEVLKQLSFELKVRAGVLDYQEQRDLGDLNDLDTDGAERATKRADEIVVTRQEPKDVTPGAKSDAGTMKGRRMMRPKGESDGS